MHIPGNALTPSREGGPSEWSFDEEMQDDDALAIVSDRFFSGVSLSFHTRQQVLADVEVPKQFFERDFDDSRG